MGKLNQRRSIVGKRTQDGKEGFCMCSYRVSRTNEFHQAKYKWRYHRPERAMSRREGAGPLLGCRWEIAGISWEAASSGPCLRKPTAEKEESWR